MAEGHGKGQRRRFNDVESLSFQYIWHSTCLRLMADEDEMALTGDVACATVLLHSKSSVSSLEFDTGRPHGSRHCLTLCDRKYRQERTFDLYDV
eukprot:scaffold26182_cov40-Prasinocladus_malaysianus.AAC.2